MNPGTYLAPEKGLCRHHGDMIVGRFSVGACPKASGGVVVEERHPGSTLPASGGGEGDADGESTRMGETERGRLIPPSRLDSGASTPALGRTPPPST